MKGLAGVRRRAADFGDLQQAAARGESWAAEALADRYLRRLASFAATRGAADPEGVAHVAFLSVLKRLGPLKFEAEEQLWAYLCQTARSRIIDEHRRTKPVELVADRRALESPQPATTWFDEQVAERGYVDDLLAPLTSEQRQVLEMRFFDDLSIEETAHQTGRTKGAVKGLQRRAINAIIAAVAIALVVLAVRGFGERSVTRGIDDDPAGRSGVVDGSPDQSDDTPSEGEPDSESQTVSDPDPESDPNPADQSEPSQSAAAAESDQADQATTTVAPADGEPLARFPITVGSARASQLNTSGAPGTINQHGARIYCPASHISYDDPVRLPGQPGAGPAQLYWGNTATDAFSTGPELATMGNSTCEGGISDRSAYWMPALFDETDQVVIPESILVEYKSFGGPTFDRTTVQPMPAGLVLVADPDVANSAGQIGSPIGGNAEQVVLLLKFPSCVAIDPGGQPVLNSEGGTAHLSFPVGSSADGSDCPLTHPYRVPQLSYTIRYAIAFGSDWYLANGDASERSATAGAISGMQPAAMAGVVTCNRELNQGCDFVEFDGDQPLYRGQLPERFAAPTGELLYTGSVSLAADADRTPFGAELTPTP